MSGKNVKTNVMRILDKENINYVFHTYSHDDGLIDAVSICKKMDLPFEKVYKTLVTVGHSKNYYVFVLPADKELDLKKAAFSVNEKNVSMIHVKDINKITGYIRGGCSPIGMKKQFKTVIDKSCLNLETMLVSAGKIGFQIELSPNALIKASGAETADILL